MRIRFIKDHKVQQGDGKGPHYKAGAVHDFTGPVARTYALKYIARGYAVEEPAPAPEPVVEAPSQPESAAEPEPVAEAPLEQEPVVEAAPAPAPEKRKGRGSRA